MTADAKEMTEELEKIMKRLGGNATIENFNLEDFDLDTIGGVTYLTDSDSSESETTKGAGESGKSAKSKKSKKTKPKKPKKPEKPKNAKTKKPNKPASGGYDKLYDSDIEIGGNSEDELAFSDDDSIGGEDFEITIDDDLEFSAGSEVFENLDDVEFYNSYANEIKGKFETFEGGDGSEDSSGEESFFTDLPEDLKEEEEEEDNESNLTISDAVESEYDIRATIDRYLVPGD